MKYAVQFLQEVRVELSKVIWPKYDEFVGSTVIVLVIVAAFAVYLGGIDAAFSQAMKLVLLKS
jgi:preprotein translocase subunit SecE